MRYKRKIFGFFALLIVIIFSCKKNEFRRDEFVDATGKAQIKVVCFSPDSTNPSAQIYINGERVSPNVNLVNEPFPGGGYNTGGASYNGYLAINPGSAEFKFATATSYSSIITKELFKVTTTLEANVKQLVFVTDTASKRTAFVVKSQTDRPDSGFVKMQFVNCMPNTAAIPVSFFFNVNGKDSLVAHNVKYKEVVDFKTLPLYASPILKMYPSDSVWLGKSVVDPKKDSVKVSPTALIGAAYTFAGMANRKVYTCVSRGFHKSTNTYASPKLSVVVVQ